VPGYPFVPWAFIVFSVIYLGFTIYNDVIAYRAAGQPALINSAFGTVLVLVGTLIYFFYRKKAKRSDSLLSHVSLCWFHYNLDDSRLL
jgi:hypothetical protein